MVGCSWGRISSARVDECAMSWRGLLHGFVAVTVLVNYNKSEKDFEPHTRCEVSDSKVEEGG